MQDQQYPERRSGRDRRRKPTFPLALGSLFGSRTCGRRKEDRASPYYVDRYSARAFGALMCVLLLSIADAFFTQTLVSEGAAELNPIMAFFLKNGFFPFFLAKYAITSAAVLFLVVHKNHRVSSLRLSARTILAFVGFLYGMLIVYEACLLVVIRGKR